MGAYKTSSNIYVDSVGNPLTYFAWGLGEPNRENEKVVAMNAGSSFEWADVPDSWTMNVVCVKCRLSHYRGPRTFQNCIY